MIIKENSTFKLVQTITDQILLVMKGIYSEPVLRVWHISQRKAAMNELIKTKRQSSAIQTARVERVIEISTDNQIKIIEKNFTFLATVGATAPFIGLFGTVWGIMNSFQSIAISRNTSLAIVAPGIAEALFATALGLLAAIPAVIAYNKFNSDLKNYLSRVENFSKRFLSII
mgnify:CR=1 FL=1